MKGVSLISVALLVAACGGTAASPTAVTSTTQITTTTITGDGATLPTPATAVTTTTSPATTTTTLLDIPQAALFLAAVDDALTGTAYQGAAFDDPEGFLATGVLFCDLLDQGLAVSEVVDAYAQALVSADPEQTVSAEELLLGGAILGAAITLICPRHLEELNATAPTT